MATVFMKWLETSPKDYDRGIQILTLGRARRLKEDLTRNWVRSGDRVLEIGCGTGTLTELMARSGADVTGVDASPRMLAEARGRLEKADLEGHVSLKYMDASLVGERFPAGSFDRIVSTLVFSELPLEDRIYVLESCKKLLAPEGRLLIADEVIPQEPLRRLFFSMVRLPLVLLTWLVTRTSTNPLRNFQGTLTRSGFRSRAASSYLGGSLVLYEARPAREGELEPGLPPTVRGTLRHRVTLGTLLLDLWLLFFRILPPYPKVRTGLYAVGTPDRDSPVLVTGNFDLTVRRLVRAIDGKLDAWLLVADSAGINVWCAAGGGYFTAEKVIAAVKASHLDEVVNHHALILPQLCANGVDGWRIRRETGWGVHWGPPRAADIPAYLSGKRQKTDEMRWVRFPLRDRLEMVTVTMGFYALLILVPVLVFWRSLFWPIVVSLVGLSYFYAVAHPWLPGRDGLYKSVPLTLIALGGLFAYNLLVDPLLPAQLFAWAIGLTALSVFCAAELQGMSPLMRGEQANWTREAAIAVVLGAIYWVVPKVVGWR
jgi:ubiquinone/menaquinone biosynthesis C-methylase UbiE